MYSVVGSTGTSVYKQSRNWVENCLFAMVIRPEGYPAKLI